ncbi:PBSX family phage terminase large subunit [Ruminiclostridium sufflavum DSM 19573]|uniref:PBSX family phage terminase large subunit n=1 Tax=Ruminiclostridium sufflavum DSM 19573 TaxID=1121337 RepID=A0A318Y3K2_9FIRM|nr:terminase [Ruminiclostridium sufflavum]PYG90148.1 PBSX family phage terminase large subunit [Ruminiclostridium sufflavum DSM 19573]
MSKETLLLSDKYKAFIRHTAPVEFLEGTTAAGKTTVGIFKFMLRVAESAKKYHIIAAKDTGTAEKNIINKDLGIIDDFGVLTEYNGNGSKDEKIPHIVYHTSNGDKIVYVMGYADKKKWQKALGGQYGCLYIDEINIADIDFVREAAMRADYVMATLNPDDPNLPVYKEYINCSRPLPEWEKETPVEIRSMLKEEPKPGWVHWFFSFTHNLGLSKEKIAQIIMNVPKGTKLYKNKIQGLRGRATGLIFGNFTREKNVINRERAKKYKYIYFSAGLDTSYSQESPDTFAFIYLGITDKGKGIVLSEEVYNNADLTIPLAPSDIAPRFFAFLERNRKEWGFARDTFIDSADQATITELNKYKREHACVYNFLNAYKKITIIDRIHLMLGWIDCNGVVFYEVVDSCLHHIGELESYSWKEDKYEPEDANDHTINASQYGWIPFKTKIGNYKEAR